MSASARSKKVARLTDDGATTRAIAALADRDVAESRTVMRGHTGVLNALRETQVEHGKRLDEHGRALHVVRKTLDTQGERLDKHGAALQTLVEGQTAILQHLGIAPEADGQGPPRGG